MTIYFPPNYRFLLCVIAISVLCSVRIDSQSLAEPTHSLRFGHQNSEKIVTLPVSGDAGGSLDCKWKAPDDPDFAEIEIIEADTFKVSAKENLKENREQILVCSIAGNPAGTFTFIIENSMRKGTLSVEGRSVENLNIVEGQMIPFRLTDGIKVATGRTLHWEVSENGGEYKITALSETSGVVNLSVLDNNLINEQKTIPVQIAKLNQALASVGPGRSYALQGELATFTDPSFKPTIPLDFSIKSPELIKRDGNSIRAESEGEAEIAVSSSTPGILEERTFRVMVTTITGITIQASGDTVLVGDRLSLTAIGTHQGRQNIELDSTKWELVNPQSDGSYLHISGTGATVNVVGLSSPPDGRPVLVKASSQGRTETYPIFIRGNRNVVDFKPIDVRIDMLDRRTAKDLFGGQAANDYHISKIRIVNDMNVREGGGPASSILFFSDALEVQVSLEKQAIEKSKRATSKAGGDEDGWVPLTYDDIRQLNNWKECKPQSVLKQEQIDTELRGLRACQLNRTDDLLKCAADYPADDIKRERCRNQVEKEYLRCEEFVKRTIDAGPCGNADCQNRLRFCEECSNLRPNAELTARNGQWIPFRPFVYQVVANTHDRRDERSLRSRIFMGANILGVGVSFLTSVAVPGAGSDLPLGLDKYQNLLMPAMERLFPSMREVQRQNILSEVLPPLVEVPFGSDVSKYVFFPKTSIYGILPGYRVRITSISSYRIQSKVGIVQKAIVNQ